MQEIRLGESPEKSNPWKTCSASFSLCTECLIPDRYPELLPGCVEVTAVAAAAAAKSIQSCPTLCDAIDGSPPGSPVPGILQARTLEWVAISFSNAGK